MIIKQIDLFHLTVYSDSISRGFIKFALKKHNIQNYENRK